MAAVNLTGWVSDHQSAREHFSRELQALFPADTEPLLRVCCTEDGYPLGYDHMGFLAPAAESTLPDTTLAKLRIAYVLVSAYYFLLDAVVDGHCDPPEDCLYLSHLLAGSVTVVEDCLADGAPHLLEPASKIIRDHISANAAAVRLELALRAEQSSTETRIIQSAAGRSNSVLLFYRLLRLLEGKADAQQFEWVFERLVYIIQCGDDYTDWRSDFNAGRWTPFLQYIAMLIKADASALSESDFERLVFAKGGFELWMARLLRDIDELRTACVGLGPGYTATTAFLDRYRERVRAGLRTVVARKLTLRSSAQEVRP